MNRLFVDADCSKIQVREEQGRILVRVTGSLMWDWQSEVARDNVRMSNTNAIAERQELYERLFKSKVVYPPPLTDQKKEQQKNKSNTQKQQQRIAIQTNSNSQQQQLSILSNPKNNDTTSLRRDIFTTGSSGNLFTSNQNSNDSTANANSNHNHQNHMFNSNYQQPQPSQFMQESNHMAGQISNNVFLLNQQPSIFADNKSQSSSSARNNTNRFRSGGQRRIA